MANRPRCGRATTWGYAPSLAVVLHTARGFTLAEILTAAIEPLMIVWMGGVVAFIAAAILLPVFKMSRLVK